MPAPDLTQVVAFDDDTQLYVIKEDTYATEKKPTATSQVLTTGIGSIMQDRGYIEDKQRRYTRSKFSRVQGRFEPGQLDASIWTKPSGAAGTKPEHAALMESLLGREVVTGGSKVEYKPDLITSPVVPLTVWSRIGHTLFRAIGVVLEEGTFPLKADNSDEAVATLSFKARFAKMLWTGTDYVATAIGGTPQATVVVNDASKFDAGGYVIIDGNDNAGAGWLINSIDYTTNTLTLATTIANVAQFGLVKPWIPAAYELGTPVHGVYGQATRAGNNLPLISASVTYKSPAEIPFDEKNGQDYPTRVYRVGKRDVDVSVEIIDDAIASKYFREARRDTLGDLMFPWQDELNTAGKRIRMYLNDVRIAQPKLSGNTRKAMTFTGKAYASVAGDDEMIVEYS